MADAVEAVLSIRPDVVLVDVQLPDGTGFDVVRTVGPQRMPQLIFVTAYDQYAVQAFEVNAVDYLQSVTRRCLRVAASSRGPMRLERTSS